MKEDFKKEIELLMKTQTENKLEVRNSKYLQNFIGKLQQ